jgi:hypothetical protein
MGRDMLFDIPPECANDMIATGKEGSNYKIVDGIVKGRSSSIWFTNIDHNRRHEPLSLITMERNLKHSKHRAIKDAGCYYKYDNYDAIEVPFTDAIPSDYDGVMGVPITFLDKYSPEQFEIVKFRHGDDGKDVRLPNGACPYFRILIKHKRDVESQARHVFGR